MNCKKLSQTIGAVTKHILTILTFAYIIIPHSSVQAKTTPVSVQIAQAKPNPKPPAPLKLNLTPQQITRIRKIREQARNDIQNVLTKKQKQQITTAIQAGQPPQRAFASIDLSNQQKLLLRNIMRSSQQNVENVLTASQKQQIQEYQKKIRQQQQLQQQPKK